MSAIPSGYRLAVLSPSGTVVESIDLDGYDLTKPIAAVDVAHQVDAAVTRDTGAVQ